jgi:hypothetical protein
MDAVKKSRDTLIDASKEFDLKLHVEKTNYVLMSLHRNAGQNQDIKIATRSFVNVAQFKY